MFSDAELEPLREPCLIECFAAWEVAFKATGECMAIDFWAQLQL